MRGLKRLRSARLISTGARSCRTSRRGHYNSAGIRGTRPRHLNKAAAKISSAFRLRTRPLGSTVPVHSHPAPVSKIDP